MRGQLYRGHANATLCSVVQWSVYWAPSRTTRVLVLAGARRCALETYGKKIMWAPLLGLAKSIYYYDSPRDLALNWGKSLRENKRQKLTSCDIKFSRYTRRRSWSIIQGRTTKELLRGHTSIGLSRVKWAFPISNDFGLLIVLSPAILSELLQKERKVSLIFNNNIILKVLISCCGRRPA